MSIIDKILIILLFVIDKLKIKAKEDKREQYTDDQNSIKNDPVDWANNRFGGVQPDESERK